MRWTSALSTRPSLELALSEVVAQAKRNLNGPADLALIFISHAFASEYPRLLPLCKEFMDVPVLVGCAGGGIIGQTAAGAALEVEDKPALALTLAQLPGVQIHPFHLYADQLPDLDSAPDHWVELVGVSPAERPHFILFADAMTARINDLLQGLDYAYPDSVKVGGLTSGVSTFAGSGLFWGDRLYPEGTIGLALSGNIAVETIVAQGCRPVGPLLQVVESDKHVLLKVEATEPGWGTVANGSAQTALAALHQALDEMNDADRTMAQNALLIGIVRDEFKSSAALEAGDFLIRNLIGVDPKIGALAIGDRIRPGQHVQFHLRDAQSSATDLATLLSRHQQRTADLANPPAGALLFDCLGRGERFYGQPHFDTQLFQERFAETPIGGFFCGGEIGPVGQATFLHGYTAVLSLFRALESAS